MSVYEGLMTKAVVAGAILLLTLPASAEDSCLPQARTDLERAYCKVVRGGEGAGLPSFEDFRRNDAMVQALLLKRPAERLGLKLPAAGARTAAVTKASEPEKRTTSRSEAGSNQLGSSAKPASRAPAGPKSSSSAAVGPNMQACSLVGQGEAISCAGVRFVLAANKQNDMLAPGVLEEGNRLNLPSYHGRRSDDVAVIRYLSDVYARYVSKMLEIGLGGATLSFTEFHHAFHTTEAAGIDFAKRSEETFQLLKADRKTMAVQTRLHDRTPASMDACMDISSDIIVCDNIGTNWVYVRPSN